MTATPTANATSILLTPGPTAVPPRVLEAMAEPIIHHRTKQFQAIFAELSDMLRRVLGTSGPALSIAGSGTTAFEACQVSLAKPGSKTLTLAGGKFGERWQDIYDVYAPHLGLTNLKIDHPWGEAFDLAQVEQVLAEHPDISVVTAVHSETSTATAGDVEALAKLVRQSPAKDALLVVDGITSVGAFPCPQDAWGIDCLVTGSQKAMMLPPGLGYVGLGERAVARLEGIDHDLPGYNLDLRKWVKSAAKNDVPFTPPVSLIRAQKVACEMMLEEGLDRVHTRTADLASRSRKAFAAMGLEPISASPSPSVSGVYYPEGVDDSAFRGAVRDKHGVHIAGGQDGRGAKWKGKIFRISHMGHVNADDTRAGLAAIEAELIAAGCDIAPSTAVGAFG